MAVSCKRLLLLAACIRGTYLVGTLLLSHYIADYDTSASLLSESCEDGWPEAIAEVLQQRPWVVWDSVFSHRIAACGYEYEQFFAFFPGFSGLVWLLRSTGLFAGINGFAVASLVLNNCLFLLSVVLLAKLSDAFLQDDKLSATAVLVFMLSPASIHNCMAYTEALFTAASWLGLYCLYCRGSSSTAALAFTLSSAARSNGLLNAGFLLHEYGKRFLKAWPHSKAHALWQALQGVISAAVTAAPYFGYMMFGYSQFCAGVYAEQQRPWCSKVLPSVYGYVQDVYWNVGLLRYYEWNQIPNFLLALPTLIMSLWGALAYACANPHLLLTGGLLTQQQLERWFSSSSARSRCNAQPGPPNNAQAGLKQGGCSSSCSGSGTCSNSRPCSYLAPVIVGYVQYVCSCGGSAQEGGPCAGAATASGALEVPVKQPPEIPGVAYQPLRQRQLEVSSTKQQLDAPSERQQQRQCYRKPLAEEGTTGTQLRQRRPATARGTASAVHAALLQEHWSCSCSSRRAYYSPGVAVFVVHWLLLTLVCLAVVHIQVATRLLSSCVPLYWFAALLMVHKGGVLRWLLWWYCFAFMGVGAVFFTNFYPWT
ncbi:GPI mannosyltransferase 2 [Scenedesmus sp. NREL 46B-D3]|nr:GPI mannosyltransferase 2 [Scenedesmus sp. NREL 46B-D3]